MGELVYSSAIGGEWAASHSCCFIPKETVSHSHWVGGWVDPRASLIVLEESHLALPGMSPVSLDIQSVAQLQHLLSYSGSRFATVLKLI
jgi:hypothetical protein